MNSVTEVLCRWYGWLIQLYPPGFRAAFRGEMEAVFADAARDASSRGWGALARLWLREVRDWPIAMAAAYWRRTREVRSQLDTQGGMTMDRAWKGGEEGEPWAIQERGRSILAALPPLVMGVGVAAAATINGQSWFDLATWERALLSLLTLAPLAILGAGGVLALVRSIPKWGYPWAGGTFVAAALALQTLAEERAEVGATIVSPGVDVTMGLALVSAGGVVLVIAALRGWAQAGLTSIGFVSTFSIVTFSWVRAAPFYRNDLVRLAAPLGFLQALLTYVYARRGRPQGVRWAVLLSIWILNAAPMLLAHRVWRPWLVARGQTSPLVPLLGIVTFLAWAGPVASLLGQPIRRSLARA